jgi:dipeptidyl aminopeptidase/acylaminoacyl peptidase
MGFEGFEMGGSMSPSVRVLPACLTATLLACTLSPLPNNRPDPPLITGPSEGYVDSTYTFTLLGKDPDSNNIKLRVAWGDADTSDWTEYIHSGETTQVSHIWTEPGAYTLRGQAMDWKDSVSDWSKGKVVGVFETYFPGRIVATIPLPVRPDFLTMTPDGEFLYIAMHDYDGMAIVLRTSDNVLVDTLRLRGLDEIAAPVMSPDGSRLYWAGDDGYVRTVRTADNEVLDSVYTQDGTMGTALSPDGNTLYVAGWYEKYVSVVRTSDMTLTDSIHTGRKYVKGVMATGDGKSVYVLCDPVLVASAETRSVVDSIDLGVFTGELLPDPEFVCLANRGSVYLVRTSDHRVVDSVSGGAWHMSAHPGGEYLYFTRNYTSDGVVVVNITDRTVARELLVSKSIQILDVACHPDGDKVYVGAKLGWDEWLYVLGY